MIAIATTPQQFFQQSPLGRALLALVLALGLTACSAVRTDVQRDETADFGNYRAFAWAEQPPPNSVAGQRVNDPDVLAELRTSLGAQLSARGLREVSADRADLLLTPHLRLQERVRKTDPYFTGYPAEKIEDALLVLEFVEPVSCRSVWTGTGRMELRKTANGVGVGHAAYNGVDNERNWRVDTMVAGLLAQFPVDRRLR